MRKPLGWVDGWLGLMSKCVLTVLCTDAIFLMITLLCRVGICSVAAGPGGQVSFTAQWALQCCYYQRSAADLQCGASEGTNLLSAKRYCGSQWHWCYSKAWLGSAASVQRSNNVSCRRFTAWRLRSMKPSLMQEVSLLPWNRVCLR